jgi:hypothetical protein
MAAPAAPGCRANMGEPCGTKRTERIEFMEQNFKRLNTDKKPTNQEIFVA